MSTVNGRKFSRRNFIKLATTAATVGPFFTFPQRIFASQKKLKIAHWSHFVPAYDQWLESYAADWGRQHGTTVTVDHIPRDRVMASAAAEVKTGRGHDLFVFPVPPAIFHQHVIDHSDLYQEIGLEHGAISQLAHLSTYNPSTKKYFAFTDSWIPAPLHFYQDYWKTSADMPIGPGTWDSLRSGSKRIHASTGVPCGLALGPGLEGSVTWQAILWGSRVLIQDQQGISRFNPILAARAIQYAKNLFEESGTPEQLTWGPSGNADAMLQRKTSCTIHPISLVRAAEEQNPDIAQKILLKPPMVGLAHVINPPFATNCWAIWQFAENPEGARQFVADFVNHFSTAYDMSRGCNFPMYQKTVPNLVVRLANDPKADPPFKYEALQDALHWTRNVGFPGFSTPAAMEVFQSDLFSNLFASVVKNEISPEDAAQSALNQVNRIFEKWKQTA